ncbi:unnamed protein product [Nippostrongylus brasiliensis]|uniref:CPBP family intramembrane metalloprotease n=1 Tax=Nippostrongylus brasiliensis TaxID=27835 RepID=A0A0N4Y2L7_NIPBR|nr:unnamed protein product [Nippostrongylus brasiliensis]
MWFEERSWSNLRMSDLVEEWRDLWSFKVDFIVAAISYVFATTNFLNLPKLILENGGRIGIAQVLFTLLVLATMTRLLGWLFLFVFHLFWTIQANRPGIF